MTTSLGILYGTLIAGLGLLVTAWAWGDLPEHEHRFFGRSPVRPDLRNVLVTGESRIVRHQPAPSVRHHG
ncbi:MAG: hypothetical protein IIB27_04215 [Chloroflexi bacterium]|nr:hypothetical protein [Chloroflexota bacterium]